MAPPPGPADAPPPHLAPPPVAPPPPPPPPDLLRRRRRRPTAPVGASPGLPFPVLRLPGVAPPQLLGGPDVPFRVMAGEPAGAAIREAPGGRGGGARIAAVEQFVSVGLTPGGEIFRDAE